MLLLLRGACRETQNKELQHITDMLLVKLPYIEPVSGVRTGLAEAAAHDSPS